MKGRYIKHLEALNRGTRLQLGWGKPVKAVMLQLRPAKTSHLLSVPFLHWKD